MILSANIPWEGPVMGVWLNWGLVVFAISFIVGDLVLEVYASVSLAVLGVIMLGGGILGLAIDSAAVGLGTAFVAALVYMAIHRGPGHMLPKRASGH
jgi:uncharacterized PurR-regulated membrane protein YhhQ (DUF165 family)